MKRIATINKVRMAAAVANSTEISLGDFEWFEINPCTAAELVELVRDVGAAQGVAATGVLTWYSSPESGGTYVACYTIANAALTQTITAAKAHQGHAELTGRRFLKAVAATPGYVDIILKG